MLFLIYIYIVFAGTDDFVEFNSTLSSTLKYGQFLQLTPNSFGMGSNSQYPMRGNALINLTISSPQKTEFDIFILDSPYNQFYICYVHLSERAGENCTQLVQELCKPCPENSTFLKELISKFIQAVMSVQLNYQFSITNSTNLNTICFLGCQGSDLGSFIISNASYAEYQNAASYFIIDNTPFPDLHNCSVTPQNCENPNTTISPCLYNNGTCDFCNSTRNVSCVQQFQNILHPSLDLNIDFNIRVEPDNYPYYVQYMVMIILVIIIVFLFIILCVVAIRFKKVKKRKLLIMKKQK